jgi:hypothetical protein
MRRLFGDDQRHVLHSTDRNDAAITSLRSYWNMPQSAEVKHLGDWISLLMTLAPARSKGKQKITVNERLFLKQYLGSMNNFVLTDGRLV